MKLSGLITLALLLTLSGTSHSASINERQANQKERIQQGIESGELTKREATRMIKQQKRIARKEKAYRSDGKLTRAERFDLQTDLNGTSTRIFKQKHDGQSR